ncbi:Deoxycytidine monophosphate (dCMP) deaminase [Myotisia sp. PD_48]|nr:Deoxycytidine monophosphate (dCMP) deaminase [Myotisia sp. PD_48]
MRDTVGFWEHAGCTGICAGKASVEAFLIKNYGFQRLEVASSNPSPLPESRLSEQYRNPATSDPARIFQTTEELIEFVTPRWREHWVTMDIQDGAALEKLRLRPFFLLIGIDAPITLRWRRFTDRSSHLSHPFCVQVNLANFSNRCWRKQLEPLDLEKFVLLNDHSQYDPQTGVAYLVNQAHLRLFNTSSSIQELHTALENLDLLSQQRLRPSWDQYFMQLASLAAQRSNCMKRRVGCVLVKDNCVMSTGYNGTPRNMKNCNEGGCARCNLGQSAGTILATCLCIHAEENALLEAGRQRIGEGSIIYCNTVKIAQVGISEVVYSQGYHMDAQTAAVLKEAGVKLRQFSPPCNRLIDLREVGTL